MSKKVHVFNAGPCLLPQVAIDHAIEAMKDFAGTGISVLSISHRTKEWDAVIVQKIAGKNYRIHFDYLSMNAVMKVLKDMDLPQWGQEFGEQCSLCTRVRLSEVESFAEKLNSCAKVEEM